MKPLEHPTWQVHDASKIQEYMRCPRKYFFKYVLGWRPDETSIHLVFGEAWHRGMEKILQHGYTKESVFAAIKAFNSYYKEIIPEIDFPQYYPKVPGQAAEGFASYWAEYGETDPVQYEVLFTEVSGFVPVAEDRNVHFRLDSILRDKRKEQYLSFEHKTGSMNSGPWRDSWLMKMQISLYTHVLRCVYGDDVYGVIINASFFYKKMDRNPEHLRVPVKKGKRYMQAWLHNVNGWLDEIELDFKRLEGETDKKPVMEAFKMCTESCVDYGKRCEFFDICYGFPNPLVLDKPPAGYVTEYWDPRKSEEQATTLFRDGKLIRREDIDD